MPISNTPLSAQCIAGKGRVMGCIAVILCCGMCVDRPARNDCGRRLAFGRRRGEGLQVAFLIELIASRSAAAARSAAAIVVRRR